MSAARSICVWGSGLALLALASAASAVPIGVAVKKLVVVDKLSAATKAKAVFVAKDTGVTKGVGTDPAQISVQFDVVYGNGNAAGAFALPAGASVDKSPGWVVNKDAVAKYVNKGAPGGPTEAKVAVIKPGKLLKLVGKGLGDTALDILGAGDPGTGGVQTAYCVTNAGEEYCHCSSFSGCTYKPIAGGTGAKLVCKTGTGNPSCAACVATSGTFCDLGNGTIYDLATDLQWEKKDGHDPGSDPGFGSKDPMNLHDVDNAYAWAGTCSIDTTKFCQPNAAAAATCADQTGGAEGCSECQVGDGTCLVGFPFAFGTIWDWVNQMNAAAFAGHVDWRPATADTGPGNLGEFDSIMDPTAPGCTLGGPCIDPLFGPTVAGPYWSASDAGPGTGSALAAEFGLLGSTGHFKSFDLSARAARTGP